MINDDIEDQIKNRVDAIEEVRVLFGHLIQPQAEHWMKKHHSVRNRGGPHLTDVEWEKIWNKELMDEFIEIYSFASSATPPNVDFEDGDIELKDIPDSDTVEEHVSQFKQSQYFQETMQSVSDESWEIKLVPIESLVAWQPQISTAAYENVPTSDDGWLDVFSYCLPFGVSNYLMNQLQHVPGNSGTVQFVSRSPNVNIYGPEVQEITELPEGNIAVQFQIRTRPNFVQVAHYDGRYYLKNGYHRSYQLMKKDEECIPAVVVDVENIDQTGAPNGGFFTEEKLTGERPPLLADFNSDLAVDFEKKVMNTVVRIEGKKFNVER